MVARLLALILYLQFTLVASGEASARLRPAPEPVIDDKPLSAWIEMLKDKRLEIRIEAMSAIWRTGARAKAAVPALIEAAHDGNAETARIALQVLGSIGPEAYPAVPMLAAILGGPHDDARCREQVSRLVGELDSEVFEVRRAARRELHGLGRLALPVLREAAKGQHSSEVRRRLDDLLEEAEKRDIRMRFEAATALRTIGLKARPALPVLLDAFEDQSEAIAEEAGAALASTGEVSALIKALKASDPARRIRAARACLFSPDGKELVAPLIRAMKDEEPRVREEAIRSLGRFGPEAEAAVPALKEVAKNYGDEFGLDWEACRALAKIGYPVDEINGLKMTLRIHGWEGSDKVKITVTHEWTRDKKTTHWAFGRPWYFIVPNYWDAKGRRVECEFKSDPIGWTDDFRQGKRKVVEMSLTVPVPEKAVSMSIPDGSGLETLRVHIPEKAGR
jgi:HEAT repeat protein